MTKMNLADIYYELQKLYREVPFITQAEAKFREHILMTHYKRITEK